MMKLTNSINWLAIVLAFVPYFILGALWFTLFFKKAYAASLGKENNMPEKPASIFIIGPALCTLVITIATSFLMNILGLDTYIATFKFSLIIGFGYLFANTMNIAINPNIPKPLLYGVITGAYHLTGIIMATSILFFMQ